MGRTIAALALGLRAVLSTAAMAANGHGYDYHSAAYDYDSGFYIGANAAEIFNGFSYTVDHDGCTIVPIGIVFASTDRRFFGIAGRQLLTAPGGAKL